MIALIGTLRYGHKSPIPLLSALLTLILITLTVEKP
jgi:hypothetical protein